MDLPKINPYEEQAIDTVISILNTAREKLGERQTLKGFANSRAYLASKANICLSSLQNPIALTGLTLIQEIIEKKWKLTQTFKYTLNYKGASHDEFFRHYYFEAIFSQPTTTYPIPQATVSVFFRIQEQLIDAFDYKGVPQLTFIIEGHNTEHDARYVRLATDWILAELQMKMKLFRRVEELRLF